MFLKRLFSAPAKAPVFSRDLPDPELFRLSEELRKCVENDGGRMVNARRSAALVRIFIQLSPEGRRRFVDAVTAFEKDPRKSAIDSYGRIEESEFIGRGTSRLALFDAFEAPRRRLLRKLTDADTDGEFVSLFREIAPSALQADLAAILDGETG